MSSYTQDEFESLLSSSSDSSSGSGSGTTTYTGYFVGDLTGDVTGNVTGNATSATNLATPQNLNFIGSDATGVVSGNIGNGNQNINITLSVHHAASADSATTAQHTDSCDYADLANLANYATTAGSANYATSATNDGKGNNIADQFADHETRITANTTRNGTQDNRLTALETLTSTHTTQISDIQDVNTTQNTRLTALEDYTNVLDWSASTIYAAGNIVVYQYNFYQSLVANNTGNYPTDEDSAYWKLLSETASGGTADCVHLTGEETITGDKTFAGTVIVPTQTAGDNSTKAASTAYADTAVSTLNTSLATSFSTAALSVSGDMTVTGAINGNATTATTASKLGSATLGSSTTPIYLNQGVATACNEMLDLTSNQEATGLKYFSSGAFAVVPDDPEDEAITNVLYVKGLLDTLDISVREEIALATKDFGGVNLLTFVG